MPAQIIIPRLGWAMEEGVFVGWLKRDGDTIREGEPLFSLEGEKAVEEVESLDAGILRIPPDAPKAGDAVVVGALIAYVVQPGEAAPFENGGNAASEKSAALPSPSPSTSEGRGEGEEAQAVAHPSPPAPVPQGAREVSAAESAAKVELTHGNSGRGPAISPRARRAAEQLGVDVSELQGTGRTGRIRERDIVAASQTGGPNIDQHASRLLTGAAPREKPSEPSTSVSHSSSAPTLEPQALSAIPAAPLSTPLSTPSATPLAATKSPATPLRRTIAERMLHSQQSTAPVTLNTTADVSTLVDLRRQLKECSPADEVPSFTDLLIRLTAPALAAHPALNSRWDDDQIVTSNEIHIGVAVDTEAGLLVPVLRDVAALNLRQISTQLRDLAARARRRELKADELRGGTFTITNLGSFGIDAFTPIINYPECAVLGVGRIVRQPIVGADDQIIIQDRISLSLTFDHRIVDGAPAARFLQQITRYLENPIPRLIS